MHNIAYTSGEVVTNLFAYPVDLVWFPESGNFCRFDIVCPAYCAP